MQCIVAVTLKCNWQLVLPSPFLQRSEFFLESLYLLLLASIFLVLCVGFPGCPKPTHITSLQHGPETFHVLNKLLKCTGRCVTTCQVHARSAACSTYHLPFFLSVKPSCGTCPHPFCMFLPLGFQSLVYNLLLLH